MYIYLANHHDAIIFIDRKGIVTVSNMGAGTLTVNGKDYSITNGGASPAIEIDNATKIKAAFTTSDGIRYTVVSPRMDKGILSSRPDPYVTILLQRIKIDELEKGLEDANERIRRLEGMHERRALNGIFNFKEV